MRDVSAANAFCVGDSVRVVTRDISVTDHGNLYHQVGTVVETWEKCDVDPTCCCAEQVDDQLAVRVQFVRTAAATTTTNNTHMVLSDNTMVVDHTMYYYYYFAEDELEMVSPQE